MGTVRYEQVAENGQLTIKEIHKIVVHKFSVGDVEDPDLYAAQPLWEWEKSDSGQFIMKHAIQKPEWKRYSNHEIFSYNYVIIAELEKSKLAEFYLRWSNIK
jgi:hypothetical protein